VSMREIETWSKYTSGTRDIHDTITCTAEVAWKHIKGERFGSGKKLGKRQKAVVAEGAAHRDRARHSGRAC